MEPIQYVGLDEVDQAGRQVLDRLSAEYHEKIQRSLNNPTSLQIHIKVYSKEGKKKYSIHVKAVAATRLFQSTKAHDWDLARTLHKAFQDIEHQIKHKLHTDEQRPKVTRRELVEKGLK
ncbi:hypothetical protein HYS47_05295 [Candidatus Woesearchaeota archaeon]|nr:hypothetical protein [Candidatus Woesearchaeota archaeon]